MSRPNHCPTCGALLESTRLVGVCPGCAWKSLLDGESGESEGPESGAKSGLLRIPGYQILSEIARGGMGIVYRARQFEPQREVALKMLLPHQLSSTEMRERFRMEARTVAGLEHSGILPIFEFGEHEGMPFFTMKLAAGGSLADRRDHYAGQWRSIADLMALVAEAVHHAHEHGVLHRDLKPGNILFDASNHPFVSDFGLAKISGARSVATRTGNVFGTPQYLAPEIARGSAANATTASDQYSLGAILYELLAGKPPFVRDDMMELLRAIAEEPIREPRVFNPQIPHTLQVICLKALSKEPGRRYASAGAMALDLRDWLAGKPIQARPVGVWERVWLWSKRHRVVAALLGIVIFLVATLAVGSTAAAVRLKTSAREVEQQLWLARLARARDARLNHHLGERQAGLDEFSKASVPAQTPGLADERLAHLPLVDIEPLPESFTLPTNSPLGSFSFDPDLQRVSGWLNGGVEVIDLGNHSSRFHWNSPAQHPVVRTQFTPSGSQVLVEIAPHGPFVVLDSTSGTPMAQVESGDFLGFTPDSKAMVFRENSLRRAILFLDLLSGHELWRIQPGPSISRIATVGSDPADKLIAVSTLANIQVLDSETGIAHGSIPHASPASQLSIGHGFLAVGEENGSLTCWDLLANRRFNLAGHRAEISRLTFTPGGKWLISSSIDGECRIWDPFIGSLAGITERFEVLAVDRAGTHAMISTSNGFQKAKLQPGSGRTVLDVRRSGPGTIRQLDCSQDNREVLVSRFGGPSLFDTRTGRELAFLPKPGTTAAYFIDAHSILTGDRNCLTHVRIARDQNTPTLFEEGEVDLPNSAWLAAPSLSSDRKWLIAHYSVPQETAGSRTSGSGAVVGGFGWPFQFQVQSPGLQGIQDSAIHRDGQWCAFTTDRGLHVIPLGSTPMRSVQAQESGRLSPSPDGRFLAVCGPRSIHVFQTSDWSVCQSLELRTGTGNDGIAAWSPDNRLLAIAKGLAPVEIWRTRDWSRLASIESPNPLPSSAMVFSRDSRQLAVGTEAGRIEVWHLSQLLPAPRLSPTAGIADGEPNPPEVKDSPWRGRPVHWPGDPDSSLGLTRTKYPARDPRSTENQIDLGNYFNAPLDGPWPLRGGPDNTLGSMPRGLQSLGGIPYEIRGVLLLNSMEMAPLAPSFPWDVPRIPVRRTCRALHFLQCAANAYGYLPDGFEVCRIQIHYANGTTESQPLRLQHETGDWWYDPANLGNLRESQVVWTGMNAASEPNGRGIRVLHFGWQNPHPDLHIDSLSLVSARDVPNFLLLAITLE